MTFGTPPKSMTAPKGATRPEPRREPSTPDKPNSMPSGTKGGADTVTTSRTK